MGELMSNTPRCLYNSSFEKFINSDDHSIFGAISRLSGIFVCVAMQKDMFFKRKGTEKNQSLLS